MAKVLLMEDDSEFAALLTDSLIDEGHAVEVFGTATEALDALPLGNFDVVVTDVFIKDDDTYLTDGGIRLVSSLKQIQNSKLPIIAISGGFTKGEYGAVEGTMKAVGANVILAKPFHPEELLDLIHQLTKKF